MSSGPWILELLSLLTEMVFMLDVILIADETLP